MALQKKRWNGEGTERCRALPLCMCLIIQFMLQSNLSPKQSFRAYYQIVRFLISVLNCERLVEELDSIIPILNYLGTSIMRRKEVPVLIGPECFII
jgi:hypothetical protein